MLILELTQATSIQVGRLGRFNFCVGWYLYVGSAFGPGGVQARCRHHQRIAHRLDWHIDYLRAQCQLQEVWYSHALEHLEHEWARQLQSMPGSSIPIPGFGSSDCNCPSHLFYFSDQPLSQEFTQFKISGRSGEKVIYCKTC